jgi:hypothetical protein
MPNSGLNGDNASLSVAPSGGGDLTGAVVNSYGINALNAYILQTLNALRNNVFPDATQ